MDNNIVKMCFRTSNSTWALDLKQKNDFIKLMSTKFTIFTEELFLIFSFYNFFLKSKVYEKIGWEIDIQKSLSESIVNVINLVK